MRFSAAAILAAAGLAAAQLESVPSCALTCLNTALSAGDSCAPGNIACLCSPANFQAILTAATPCVIGSCGQDVAVNQVLPAASRLCANLNGGGPATAASSAASSALVSLSSAASAAASSAVSAASSRAASPSGASVVTITSTTGAVSTRTAVVTNQITTTANGTSPAAPTLTPITVNGAAVHGPVGALALLAAAAAAFF
ncbi:hypothetical protein C8035_v006317 [Colletotrichum spinosum]|uniref:CFEM domain-containing protein n=1 Tax=Colletotrichum spinosum TaxID=1347390 RepID=A0A4R8QJR1_9PEZI|nr:hypothetical protein C8035_v006317 [Colletotrichum spinosum]